MSTLNIVVLIILILVILLLSMLVISLNKEKIVKKEEEILSEEMHIPMPNAYGLSLPPQVDNISKIELFQIVKKIFNPFKYLDYKNKSIAELDKKEWHSWQISILLSMYKRDEEFFITDQEEYFHSILLNANENDIKSLMTSIIKKYKNYVESNKSKDELSKNYIWSNKDASIIFYFLANYKKYSR